MDWDRAKLSFPSVWKNVAEIFVFPPTIVTSRARIMNYQPSALAMRLPMSLVLPSPGVTAGFSCRFAAKRGRIVARACCSRVHRRVRTAYRRRAKGPCSRLKITAWLERRERRPWCRDVRRLEAGEIAGSLQSRRAEKGGRKTEGRGRDREQMAEASSRMLLGGQPGDQSGRRHSSWHLGLSLLRETWQYIRVSGYVDPFTHDEQDENDKYQDEQDDDGRFEAISGWYEGIYLGGEAVEFRVGELIKSGLSFIVRVT